jgi:hypothetical protein
LRRQFPTANIYLTQRKELVDMNEPNQEVTNLPPGLSAIAGNRDLITTPEIAQVFNVASQTVRKNYSLTGEAYGIRPTKIGNRLLWSVAKIADKLRGVL